MNFFFLNNLKLVRNFFKKNVLRNFLNYLGKPKSTLLLSNIWEMGMLRILFRNTTVKVETLDYIYWEMATINHVNHDSIKCLASFPPVLSPFLPFSKKLFVKWPFIIRKSYCCLIRKKSFEKKNIAAGLSWNFSWN